MPTLRSPHRYPVGRRSTLQPATVLVFACVTGTLSATVAIEAVQALASGEDDTIPLSVGVYVAIGLSVFVNALMFAVCYTMYLRTGSVTLRALALDFRNDSVSFVLAATTTLLVGRC